MSDSAAARVMQREASGASTPAEQAEVGGWINQICRRFHYAGATLTDLRGSPVVSVGRFFANAGHVRALTEEVLRSNDIVFHDLRVDKPGGAIHLGFNLPLRASPELKPFGALLLSIDPSARLFPLLEHWPVPSESGETLLVRRDGDDVLFLNHLRFRPNDALGVRVPLSRRDNPAVQAVLGANGIVEGQDYRGVPVIAAVRAVPELPWFLMAKMDTDEVEAPIRRRA